MLDGLAVNELIVGFVAARAIPLRLTQTRKVSRIKEALPQHTATRLPSTALNCSFTAPEIFIFHLGFWITNGRQFCGDTSTTNGPLNERHENFTSAHFYITLMDFYSSARQWAWGDLPSRKRPAGSAGELRLVTSVFWARRDYEEIHRPRTTKPHR